MSNFDSKKTWKKWCPKEIILNDFKKKYNFFWNTNIFKETDFHDIQSDELTNNSKQLENEKQNSSNNHESSLLNIKKKLEEKKQKYTSLNNELKVLFLNLKETISLFEKTLFSRLLKTTLIISSYIIGENICINKSILLNNISKIIKNDNFFFKKPRLLANPGNKKILEKNFKEFINSKQWDFIYNTEIDIHSFKIQTESSNIDATIDARWKEIYRMILKEEEYE